MPVTGHAHPYYCKVPLNFGTQEIFAVIYLELEKEAKP